MKEYRRIINPSEGKQYWKATVVVRFDTARPPTPIVYKVENINNFDISKICRFLVDRNTMGLIALSYGANCVGNFPINLEEQLLAKLECYIVKHIKELVNTCESNLTLVNEDRFLKASYDALQSPIFRQAKIKLITQ